MTKEFIKEVLSVPSCSGKETMLREYIERFADERGIAHHRDGKGNLYLTKGNPGDGYYPCLVNHMDTVQTWQGAFVDQARPIDILERVRGGHTELYAEGGGIGADDKLGCAIALALVDVLPVVKAVFFVEEELGMLGSRELDMDWFGDVGFCLSFDSPDRNRASRNRIAAIHADGQIYLAFSGVIMVVKHTAHSADADILRAARAEQSRRGIIPRHVRLRRYVSVFFIRGTHPRACNARNQRAN